MPPRRSILDASGQIPVVPVPVTEAPPPPVEVASVETWESAEGKPSTFPVRRTAGKMLDLLNANTESKVLRSYIGSVLNVQITSIPVEDAITKIKEAGMVKSVPYEDSDPGLVDHEDEDEEEEDPNEVYRVRVTLLRTYTCTRTIVIHHYMDLTLPRLSDDDDANEVIMNEYSSSDHDRWANDGEVMEDETSSGNLNDTEVVNTEIVPE